MVALVSRQRAGIYSDPDMKHIRPIIRRRFNGSLPMRSGGRAPLCASRMAVRVQLRSRRFRTILRRTTVLRLAIDNAAMSKMNRKTVRVAIMGPGVLDYHAQRLRKVKNCRVVAAMDVDYQRERRPFARSTTSLSRIYCRGVARRTRSMP